MPESFLQDVLVLLQCGEDWIKLKILRNYPVAMLTRGDDTLKCPNCGKVIKISELMPVFKKEYVNPDGSLKLSRKDALRGGWLKKVLEGFACPNCGEIIGKPE
jgi:predicted RNA-binding Zn-ribbon protein involved in translation (DUF1610 family)